MRQFMSIWTRLFVILSFCIVSSLPLGAVHKPEYTYFEAIKKSCGNGNLGVMETVERQYSNANYANMTENEFRDTPLHHIVRHNGPVGLFVHLMNRGLYDADNRAMELATDLDAEEEKPPRTSNLKRATELEEQKKLKEKIKEPKIMPKKSKKKARGLR